MLINIEQDADLASLIKDLEGLSSEVRNLRGPARMFTADEVRSEYLKWVSDSRRRLRSSMGVADIDQVVITPRFGAVMALQPAHAGSMLWEAALRASITEEIEEVERQLQAAVSSLKQWARRLETRTGHFVVADSSVYCHHQDRLDVWDVGHDAGVHSSQDVHLVVPMPVLDELDRQKDRGQGGAKTNARTTIQILDGLLPSGEVRPPDMKGLEVLRGSLTVDLWPDPHSHQRLPIADDEIIARAAAFQALAGRKVTLLTGDVGMSIRARLAGLKPVRLNLPNATHKPPKQPKGTQHPANSQP